MYFVGTSPAGVDEQAARREAYRDGVRQLVESFGFQASTSFKSERTEASNTVLDQVIGTSENARVENLEIQEVYLDRDRDRLTVFVLLRMSKAAYDQEKDRIAELVASRHDITTAVGELADGLNAVLNKPSTGISTISIGEVNKKKNARDPVARALKEELAQALARQQRKTYSVALDDAEGSVAISYQLTSDRDLRIVVSLLKEGRVIWASEPSAVSKSLLPPDLKARLDGMAESRAERSIRETGARARVMVVIPETHIRRKVPDPAAETEISRILIDAGFTVLDQSRSRAIREDEAKLAEALGRPEAAAALGREMGADIIVTGEAFAESADQIVPGVYSARARVEAKAIRCDTAEILATNGFESGASDIAELIAGKKALRAAGQLLGDYLSKKVTSRVSRDADAGTPVELVVIGATYGDFRLAVDRLKRKARTLTDARELSFAGGVGRIEAIATEDIDDVTGEVLTVLPAGEFRLMEKTGTKLIFQHQ